MLQGYRQSNCCVYVVLWEDVVTNLQMDIFNCYCCGYRATTDRKSLLGISGLVKIFYVAYYMVIFILNRLVFKISLLFCAQQ